MNMLVRSNLAIFCVSILIAVLLEVQFRVYTYAPPPKVRSLLFLLSVIIAAKSPEALLI